MLKYEHRKEGCEVQGAERAPGKPVRQRLTFSLASDSHIQVILIIVLGNNSSV